MWVQVAILVVSMVLSYATRPKPRNVTPSPGSVDTPVVEEGTSVRKVYGTVWVDDPQVLGFKRIGTDRIQKSGGGKK